VPLLAVVLRDADRVEALERAGFVVDVFTKDSVFGPRRNVETRLLQGADRARRTRAHL